MFPQRQKIVRVSNYISEIFDAFWLKALNYTSQSVNFLPCLDDNYDAVDSTWKTAYKCSSKRLEISLSDVDIFKGLLWLSVDEMIFCLRAFYDVTSTTRKVAVAARNGYYFGEHCCLPEKLIQPAINQTNRTNLWFATLCKLH